MGLTLAKKKYLGQIELIGRSFLPDHLITFFSLNLLGRLKFLKLLSHVLPLAVIRSLCGLLKNLLFIFLIV